MAWSGRQAIVTFPEHVGAPDAALIGEQLLEAFGQGTVTLMPANACPARNLAMSAFGGPPTLRKISVSAVASPGLTTAAPDFS